MGNPLEADRYEPSWVVRLCAIVAFIGAAAAVISDVIGIVVVDGYNPISETISDLAAGRNSWIQDSGLQVFALGFIAIGIGMLVWNLGGWRWKGAAISSGLLGIVISVIAAYNEYGDGEPGGIEIHIYLVYALGALFAFNAWAVASDLERVHPRWKMAARITLGLWVVLAPIFLILPTGIDGAYERAIGLILIAWQVIMGWLLWKWGQGDLDFIEDQPANNA